MTRIETSDDMERLGAALASVLRRGDVLVLNGPLGAGKTTLVRGLGEALGVRGAVASPTFVIARTHPSLGDGPALIHVDAYRLTSALELDDLDLDLDSAVTVIEWGSAVVGAITDEWLELDLARPRAAQAEPAADDSGDPDAAVEEPREVTLRAVGDRFAGVTLEALLADDGAAPRA
ncbi:tRNA (adenosine(37)-N6)-threonylcarbamoyltransferase complex ATPase subunit type 1 TsaE [Gulosibacter sp. ACHW.36C]|uniref:tRNA threonylcarbamoyladenosine biosynthesis protein TsaE n=1 Tax=Gulosibacter sediminis TaxID=1729695 RepID=A0ABY4MY38_9MICO|nr:tRNA (adenosine(37)-N6)-threonylcarbamoyltransferase complex ATPase subunit type 1 TsaE [Gulosibacter sediminis]UQN14306.1 tRNA (adenosine(37)-N6)-threonylcarbamoyltransferase complex ATPase subunit type 1 TsaE [Gulosibacter sediminis]